jgi:hypothetical protein
MVRRVIRPPIHLRTPTLRQFCASYVLEVAPDGCVVSFKENTRSLEQNALLWSRLTELSERLPWDGEKLTPAEYKDLLTACLRKQKVVRGVEGGLVFLGARTSQMSKSEMNDLLTLMEAFAAERGVEFGDQVVEFSR